VKFLCILCLTGAALAQQAAPPSASAQLPIKPGEWKMIAVIHRAEGDQMQSFFTCNQLNDLAHLVPQPANLPKEFSCAQDSQQLTATGEVLVFTCKSPGSLVHATYDLTRNSDSLVTGTMKMAADAGGKHEESTTNIAYQWQQAECTRSPATGPAK
jgi:hypothetical protein